MALSWGPEEARAAAAAAQAPQACPVAAPGGLGAAAGCGTAVSPSPCVLQGLSTLYHDWLPSAGTTPGWLLGTGLGLARALEWPA